MAACDARSVRWPKYFVGDGFKLLECGASRCAFDAAAAAAAAAAPEASSRNSIISYVRWTLGADAGPTALAVVRSLLNDAAKLRVFL